VSGERAEGKRGTDSCLESLGKFQAAVSDASEGETDWFAVIL
jgi:hypothetical protein